MPGLDVARVATGMSDDDFERALVIDSQGARFVVQVPRHVPAGAALEADVTFVDAVAKAGAQLPFAVPRPTGFVPLPTGGRAMVYPALAGAPIVLNTLVNKPELAASLGRAIAAIHKLSPAVVASTAGTVYGGEDVRLRLLAELDEVAATGRAPARLLQRWESILEDMPVWRMHAVVVHGDLAEENVLVEADQVVGVQDWADARISDPAEDLSWLVAALPTDVFEMVMAAYNRECASDGNLMTRVELGSQLALARWLLYGVRNEDNEIIADAVSMLDDLDEILTAAEERARYAAQVLAEVQAADAEDTGQSAHTAGVVQLGLSRAVRGDDAVTAKLDLSVLHEQEYLTTEVPRPDRQVGGVEDPSGWQLATSQPTTTGLAGSELSPEQPAWTPTTGSYSAGSKQAETGPVSATLEATRPKADVPAPAQTRKPDPLGW